MADQNTFINTYIDVTVNTLLDNIKTNLQLQTQAKVNEIVVVEKDQAIAILRQTIAERDQQLLANVSAEDWKTRYEAAETNYSAALGKLSHMDTVISQISDMKKQIIIKDAKIAEMEKELAELKISSSPAPVDPIIVPPPKVINTKLLKKKDLEVTPDDF